MRRKTELHNQTKERERERRERERKKENKRLTFVRLEGEDYGNSIALATDPRNRDIRSLQSNSSPKLDQLTRSGHRHIGGRTLGR